MALRYEVWLAEGGMRPTQLLLKFATKEEAAASKSLDQVIVGKNDAILLIDTETRSQVPLRMGDEWPP
ncbi:hypothetical protein ACEQ38_09060 [Ralstonia syzygii subsp. celebesensis]|uniref:Uncharacterized protein n=2 Tax=Ralstonia syzygii subsp. celebesensis TaxID=1310168 RepID=A0A1U9VG19_9RALS|nr:hypothetical protein [Ralstonia syzygii]AQW29021.1 hypothetical protein B0B51_02625 [blood disease bacterium A2-HR MARDI]QQV54436.1 hypothetical protein JK151_09500 [Ralstonia syzygii subsp. celebesensis]CCA79288.1 hypothetical protein BDB_40241 [blood disease bacterium R229]